MNEIIFPKRKSFIKEVRHSDFKVSRGKTMYGASIETENGDFADIKESLTNLCDWSIESHCEDGNFRVNYLHSNNVKDIEPLEKEPIGFTHILRFYR